MAIRGLGRLTLKSLLCHEQQVGAEKLKCLFLLISLLPEEQVQKIPTP